MKPSKDLVGELALMVRLYIFCTENGILPAKHSPCHKKAKELYLAYRSKVKR